MPLDFGFMNFILVVESDGMQQSFTRLTQVRTSIFRVIRTKYTKCVTPQHN